MGTRDKIGALLSFLSMSRVLWIGALALLGVVVAALWFGGRWWQRFDLGRAGPKLARIPVGSREMHEALTEAAKRHMSLSEMARFKGILTAINRHRYDQALTSINQLESAREWPTEVTTLLWWAKSNVYQRCRRPLEEIATLNQLCAQQEHCMFELNLGQAYVKLKRYGDAEAHHLRAISLSGERDYPLARYNLGLVYCHRGQKDKALEQLRRLESSSEPVPKELILGLKRRIAELN